MSQNKITAWIIKTWKERIQADIDAGSLTTENRQNVKSKHMAAEIADLRGALATAPVQPVAVPPASTVKKVYAAAKELCHCQSDDEFVLGCVVNSALIQMCELGFGSRQASIAEIENMHKLAGKMEDEIREAAIAAVIDRLEYLVGDAKAVS